MSDWPTFIVSSKWNWNKIETDTENNYNYIIVCLWVEKYKRAIEHAITVTKSLRNLVELCKANKIFYFLTLQISLKDTNNEELPSHSCPCHSPSLLNDTRALPWSTCSWQQR